ncbi:hypothetical protein HRbin30_02102 [bacterium HR30]|nr:hypothetical protein HRbin30_02102 [bacterium HR30]
MLEDEHALAADNGQDARSSGAASACPDNDRIETLQRCVAENTRHARRELSLSELAWSRCRHGKRGEPAKRVSTRSRVAISGGNGEKVSSGFGPVVGFPGRSR